MYRLILLENLKYLIFFLKSLYKGNCLEKSVICFFE